MWTWAERGQCFKKNDMWLFISRSDKDIKLACVTKLTWSWQGGDVQRAVRHAEGENPWTELLLPNAINSMWPCRKKNSIKRATWGQREPKHHHSSKNRLKVLRNAYNQNHKNYTVQNTKTFTNKIHICHCTNNNLHHMSIGWSLVFNNNRFWLINRKLYIK